MELLRKITISRVVGSPKTIRELATEEPRQLMSVWGITDEPKRGNFIDRTTGETRQYIGLRGDFRAKNVITGVKYYSSTLYLPEFAILPVVEVLERDASRIEIAYNVSVKESEGTVTGYEYIISPLLNEEQSDPLAELETRVTHLLESK